MTVTNITESVFGSCDILNGCTPSCGWPDRPITRFTSTKTLLDYR